MSIGHRKYPVYVSCKQPLLNVTGDSMLVFRLLPSMRQGKPLYLDMPVTETLLHNTSRIQEVVSGWGRKLRKIPVIADTMASSEAEKGQRVGMFFSGGLDSFYTLLQHRDEITDIVFVHGLDVALDNHRLREEVSASLSSVAAEFGVNLIELETNIRGMTDKLIFWDIAHGFVLAGIGQLLSQYFHRIYVSSTFKKEDIMPCGSHPDVDKYWNNDVLEFIHDGCEVSRIYKTGYVTRNDIALRTLRVCYENNGGKYNCGVCEKCVRTMTALYLVGALGKCKTFPSTINADALKNKKVIDPTVRVFFVELRDALAGREADEELYGIFDDALDVPEKTLRRAMAKYWMKRELSMVLQRYPVAYHGLRNFYYLVRKMLGKTV